METKIRDKTGTLASTSRRPMWLLTGFWVCVVISIAVVIRRLVELVSPSHNRPPQMAAVDTTFSSHAVLTAAHIIPAGLFVMLAAMILVRRSRSDWLERLFFPFGAITGVTGYAMSGLCYWRLDRSFRGPGVRYVVLMVAGPCLLVPASRRCCAHEGVDGPSRGYPAWHRDDAPRDGSFFCDKPFDPSHTEAVFRDRFLDWFLD
jgi:hypothetical protein